MESLWRGFLRDILRCFQHPPALCWCGSGVDVIHAWYNQRISESICSNLISGVLTCPGIFPTAFTILWRRQSRVAVIVSPLLGMATGLAVWLGSARALYGGTTVATTGQILPCVYGTVASCFSPLPYTIILSLFNPQDFDWADFRKEKLAFEAPDEAIDPVIRHELDENPSGPGSQPHLKRWVKIAAYWSIATFFGHWVLWPLPMYASKFIFTKTFFQAWLVVAIIWLWGTLLVGGFYPLIDGHRQFTAIYKSLRYGKGQQQNAVVFQEGSSDGEVTPTEKVEPGQK